MRTLAQMGELDVWYAHTVIDDELEVSVDRTYAQAIQRTAVKARSRDNLEALSKLTGLSTGSASWPAIRHCSFRSMSLSVRRRRARYEQQMSVLIDEYRQSLDPSRRDLMGRFRYVGGARKVVGVGSVGTERGWYCCWGAMTTIRC